MDEYWNMISGRHQEKLLLVAQENGVDKKTAMRNIVNYLKNDNSTEPHYFKDFITGKHLEGMIDMIVLSRKTKIERRLRK
jgi:hypothetical protein